MPDVASLLTPWNAFYTMTGSSAAALTGLMFVVITLVNDRRRSADGIAIFSTPTVVHFATVLLLSALFLAPFHAFGAIRILIALVGTGGLVSVVRVMLRTAQLSTYRADLEDWIFHSLVPALGYILMLIGAGALRAAPRDALFAPAAAVLLLLLVGVHNAWDVVTFLASGRADALPDPEPKP